MSKFIYNPDTGNTEITGPGKLNSKSIRQLCLRQIPLQNIFNGVSYCSNSDSFKVEIGGDITAAGPEQTAILAVIADARDKTFTEYTLDCVDCGGRIVACDEAIPAKCPSCGKPNISNIEQFNSANYIKLGQGVFAYEDEGVLRVVQNKTKIAPAIAAIE